jgi:sporulation protein YunB
MEVLLLKRFRFKKNPRRFVIFLLFLCWILLFSYWIQVKSYPSVRAMAQSQVNRRLNETVLSFSAQEYTYDQFIKIQHDKSGNVRVLEANIAEINRFKADFCAYFLKCEQENGRCEFDIPIGNLSSHPLFFGKGPAITVTILPCSELNANVRDCFTSAGVNQTLHSVYLEIEAQVTILSAAGNQDYTFSDRLLLSQTLIVGEVPSLHLQNGLLGVPYAQ